MLLVVPAGRDPWLTRLMRPVAFLHTADVHVRTFGALLTDIAPEAVHAHLVDADLLADARLHGINDRINARVLARLRELAADDPGVIVCTCSTISGAAERLGEEIKVPVVRIDRPMAEAAVVTGDRVALVTAVESTLAPTRQLFEECAATAGRTVTLVNAPCPDAWELFEAGDHAGYFDRVARHVRSLTNYDVIVLAQASMAPVADQVEHLPIPVLSSSRSAVIRAVELAGE
jgi:aspartate/glutamate racemase